MIYQYTKNNLKSICNYRIYNLVGSDRKILNIYLFYLYIHLSFIRVVHVCMWNTSLCPCYIRRWHMLWEVRVAILSCGQGMYHWEFDIWINILKKGMHEPCEYRGKNVSGTWKRTCFEQLSIGITAAAYVKEKVTVNQVYQDRKGQPPQKFVGQCKDLTLS